MMYAASIIHARQAFRFVMLSLLVLAIGACAPHEFTKSHANTAPIQVNQRTAERVLDTKKADRTTLAPVSRRYGKTGKGPVRLHVSYDPASDNNTAVRASREGARLASILRDQGVETVTVDIVPIANSGQNSRTYIRFTALDAKGPPDCDMLPGLGNTPTNAQDVSESYKFGCSIDTLMARQVDRPGDLLGRAPPAGQGASGRRAGNIINRYEQGEPNEELDGETASQQ